MYIILKNLSSDEINQMYIDFVYNLKQGDFDIIKDAKIRGDIKWMIKSIDDLVGDMVVFPLSNIYEGVLLLLLTSAA